MSTSFFDILIEYIDLVFLLFSSVLFCLFIFMGYFSTRNALHYKNKNNFTDFSKIMASPIAPSITIIAPAYNESLTINTKKLHY